MKKAGNAPITALSLSIDGRSKQFNHKGGMIMGAMGARIIFFLDTQTDKLILAAMIVLIILGIGQFIRVGRTNRQLKYLTDRLGIHLR